MTPATVRPPVLAGTWYPEDPEALRASVTRLLGGTDPARLPSGRPVVLLVPHAGYAYSGRVAGSGWGLLRGTEPAYERVVILAPNHRAPLSRISVPRWEAYATPLGEVPVDRDACELLAASPAFTADADAHDHEHAEEIQLPLLQTALDPPPPVVPLLVPHLNDRLRREAVRVLSPWCDGRTLFVISTDMTHYGAAYGYLPFQDRVPDRLRELDMAAVDTILAWDAGALRDYGARTGITMCGLEAAALTLSLAWPRRPQTALIDYTRSADRDGDFSLSVSYAAVVACLEGTDAG